MQIAAHVEQGIKQEGWKAGEVLRSVSGAVDTLYHQLVALSPRATPAETDCFSHAQALAVWVQFFARTWAMEQRAGKTSTSAEVVEARGRRLAVAMPGERERERARARARKRERAKERERERDCLCICVSVCLCVYTHTHLSVCVYIHTHLYIHVRMRVSRAVGERTARQRRRRDHGSGGVRSLVV